MGLALWRITLQPARIFRRTCWFVLASTAAIQVNHLCCAEGSANKSAQIEYISPDGQFSSLTPASPALHQSAAFVDNNTVSCVLKEGETTFIIELPKNTPPDRFTFLNENAAACGELRLAVSDSQLPANSPKWTEVDGIVPFAHKRLFKLSMLGVDTKFVRLSFKVDSQRKDSAELSDPFRSSLLATSFSSKFGKIDKGIRDFSMAAVSVAPLPASQKK
jgi:hypothetical protein